MPLGNARNIAVEYERAFVGMTEVECPLSVLLDTRERLRQELPARLNTTHQQFLLSLASAAPDWSLLTCPHAAELPALRWKLNNLERFRQQHKKDFNAQITALEKAFA